MRQIHGAGHVFWTPWSSNSKELQETWIQSLGQEDSSGEGSGNLPQYSCLENPIDREAWRATVRGVANSQIRLSDLTLTSLISYIFPQAAPSIPKAWKGFPGGSDSKESACNVRDLGLTPGLGRYGEGGHGHPLQCSCLKNLHEQSSLVGYKLRGQEELDMTD